MNITSAKFVKGAVGNDFALENDIPQVAFIGRSNAGKSSLINALTNQKDLAITSSYPGRTQEMNIFLINKSLYFVDLPGYGFVRISPKVREKLQKMIDWYFFRSGYPQKYILLIIDANIGLTPLDLEMLHALDEANKSVLIIANKVDKIKKAQYEKQMETIQMQAGDHFVFPISSLKKSGIKELAAYIVK